MSEYSEKLPEFGFIPTTLIEVLAWRAEHEPDRTAYIYLVDGESEEISITYLELHRRAQAIAGMLQQQKAGGQRSLLIYPPGLDFLAAFFGCLYAGAVAVPVYPPRKDKDMIRILAVLNNSGAKFVLTTSPILSRFEKIREEVKLPELESLLWLASDQTEAIRHLAESWQNPGLKGSDLAFLQYTSGSTSVPKGVMVSHGNLIYNQRMLTPCTAHTKECVLVTWLPLYHDMGLIGNILHPLYIGFKCIFMSPEIFLQKPVRWLQAITRYRATTTGGAPNFAFELCINRVTPEQRQELDLSSWSFALVGSDTVHYKTLERFVELFGPCGFRRETFYPAFGLAEATLIVSGGLKTAPPVYLALDAEALRQHRVVPVPFTDTGKQILVGCGKTWLDQAILIVDPEQRTVCPPDRVGEIWVSGENVAQGYWNNEEQTRTLLKARLAGDSGKTFLRTGDLGFIKDGELYITGRLKNLIIIRGRNHYPQDIETTVESCAGAIRAGCSAAFTVEKAEEERLVIVAELERRFASDRRRSDQKMPLDNRNPADRRQFDEEDLGISQNEMGLELEENIAKILQAVTEHHGIRPYAIVLIRPVSLPKTTSGKIRRLECRNQFLNGKLVVIKQWMELQADAGDHATPPVVRATPSTESIQSWLLSKVAEHLKLARHQIDFKAELFRYGLDSLSAVSISGELAEWLQQPVSPTLFYNYPSIQAIAQHLSNQAVAHESSAQELKPVNQLTTPVAIVGAACRFPGANSPEAFWELLMKGIDAIREVPPERWDSALFYNPQRGTKGKMNTRWGGFLEEIDRFDPFFFGISPREAIHMDPQQRLLLEVSWEVFENAGLDVNRLAGSKTGVFVGISANEYARLALSDIGELNAYQGIGNALSIAANRISYQYDLRGPSVAVDTACSSALVSVHMACQALRTGEATLALAGGVNLILNPETTIIFSQAEMMAGDGRCKTFDEAADGYVRGEGCGLVLLKLLPVAIKDGDEILAVIRGSAINQDGRSNGITAPNGLSQQAVITQALKNAAVTPDQIGYVEAHGTGTSLGDPIEMDALKVVLMQGRSPEQTCLVGSVKTNIGHLEAAGGIAGLLKTVWSVRKGTIPAHLHFHKLNPHISLDNTPFAIPVQARPWPGKDEKRFAGVSSFGFGGTNVHLILEGSRSSEPAFATELPAALFCLSARSKPALVELARRYLPVIETMAKIPSARKQLEQLCYTVNNGRSHFNQRLALVVDSLDSLRKELQAVVEKSMAEEAEPDLGNRETAARIAFLFPNGGKCYPGMAQALYLTQPTFKAGIDRCAELLKPIWTPSLVSLLTEEESVRELTTESWPLMFAVEYNLAKLWIRWGIIPDFLLGQGVGELVAACLADLIDLETGLQLAVATATRISTIQDSNTVVLPDIPASKHGFNKPTIPIVSCRTGKLIADLGEFWREMQSEAPNQTKALQQALTTLHQAETRFWIEIGARFIAEEEFAIPYLPDAVLTLASLNRRDGDWFQLLTSLAQLYRNGVAIDWTGFYQDYPDLRKLSLPNYPFQRQRYWYETKAITPQSLPAADADLYFDFTWQPAEILEPHDESRSTLQSNGYWLIFTDSGGFGESLAGKLAGQEIRSVLVSPGTTYEQSDAGNRVIDPADPSHYDRLLHDLAASSDDSCLGMVHLWSLNADKRSEPDEAFVQANLKLGSFSALYLSQSLLRVGMVLEKGLWLVTEGTQAVVSDPPATIQFWQAAMWGLGKSVALELPGIKFRLVDTDPLSPLDSVSQLARELVLQAPDWQVAFRSSQRYVARLARSAKPEGTALRNFEWRSDGTYLITGGMGKLGLHVAEFMVNQGARRIALVGRHPLTDTSGPDQKPALQRIRRLETLGATIRQFQADVADSEQMKRVFDEIANTLPPLRGIIHAAGTVSKKAVAGIAAQEFAEVLQAKIVGTWVLHNLSRSLNLDCFVLFSSISATWGSRGIAHYAAANAFLDSFGFYRKALGMSVLTINWGPWREGGMTTHEEQTQLSRIGIEALEPSLAVEAMNRLLAMGISEKIVIRADWNRLHAIYETIGYGSLFSNLTRAADRTIASKKGPQLGQTPNEKSWLQQLTNLGDKEKISRLLGFLREEVARVMHCQTTDIHPETGLFEMGMDSLMVVELKDVLEQQLGCTLEATLIFDHPTLKALTKYLVEAVIDKTASRVGTDHLQMNWPKAPVVSGVNGLSATETGQALGESAQNANLSEIEALSEAEVARLIDEELKDI